MLFDPPFLYRLLIHIAGVGLLAVAVANFIAPRLLRYRENLASASLVVRQIFYVHSAYIVFILLGQAALCFAFAAELGGSSALGRALAAFLAVFWLTRFGLQGWYYDRTARRAYPRFSLLFLAAFGALGFTFALLAIRAPFYPL